MNLRDILEALTPSQSTIDDAKLFLTITGVGAISEAAGKVLVNSEVAIAKPIVTGAIFGAMNGYHVLKGTFFQSNASDTQKTLMTFAEYLASIGISYTLFNAMGADTSLVSNLLEGMTGFPVGISAFVFMNYLIHQYKIHQNNFLPPAEEKPARLTQ